MRWMLPYGKSQIALDLPQEKVSGVLQGRLESVAADKSPAEVIRESMRHPIGSGRLSELARGKNKVVLIASDHTRPDPADLIVPLMLQEIREGSPQADITILVATGCHRATTRKELLDKFGPEIMGREKVVVHDCEAEEELCTIGRLPSGGELRINKLAAQADLLVAEGFIEPHFFAGFSGGRKSVLPGIASRTCVHYNHNSSFIDDPGARMGVLDENPIHRDMLSAARQARLAFIVNVVLGARGEVIASFAGDCDAAHRAGAQFVREQMECACAPADVVITTNNGYPLDQNAYQMVKGMCTAETVCKKGGVIIAVGECADGVGGEAFFRTFSSQPDEKEILRVFRSTPPEKTVTDQWQSQIFARILQHHTVVLVSSLADETVRALHMIPAHSTQQALDIAAETLQTKEYSTVVIPQGISVIPRAEQ